MKARAIRHNYDKSAERQIFEVKEVNREKSADIFERLSGSKFYQKNYYCKGLQDKFPMAPQMQYVERYYPYASGGPLAIDEAGYMDDVETLKLKKQVLEKAGIRYVILKPGISQLEAMEQLA